jgi:hypothetical protein
MWETGEVHTGFRWGDLKERDHLEDLDVDGRITLKWVFKKWDGEAWPRLICLSDRVTWVDCCECGNEPLVFIKCGEFRD